MARPERFSYVFDTSAVIAYLAGESGAEQVKSMKSKAALPFMVLSELYYLIWRRKGKAEADNTYGLVKSWKLPILIPTEQVILTAGRLKALHRLGIADSYIAAFSFVHGLPLVSKDSDYEILVPELKLIRLKKLSS